MKSTSMKGLRAALLVSVALMGAPAMAQETAGQINGVIAGTNGQPLPNAQVRIIHKPTGAVSTTSTNAEGRFISRGLALGGPYEVTVTAPGGATEEVQEQVFLVLGEAYNLNYALGSRIEEITVSGARVRDAIAGVSSDFDRERIANAPTISRDLKDIIRGDSKVYIDRTNLDAIQIAGTNNRFNLLTIDGVRNNDDFGLNNNGYPGTRGPLSLDVIDQLSVNIAPYAVTYSGFQGGNINIVTKGGTNDFHGTAYYYYSDDTLLGNNSGNRAVGPFSFKDKTYGGTFGGPIIEDKLFFFAGYEHFTTGNPVTRGPKGAGFTNSVDQVTQANYDQIKSIAQSVYNYDILGLPSSLEEADEKIFGKINWNLNDDNRIVVSYTHNKGNFVTATTPISASTATSVAQAAALSSGSDWYNNIQKVDSVSSQWFSDWTDAFKTEVKVGYKKQTADPTPLGNSDFAEMQVVIPASANGTTTPGLLTFGPDRSRHFNSLSNELWTIKAKGDYLIGDHTVTGGYEREMLDVFNAFLQDAKGTYVFNSIADFQARNAQTLVYQNAISGNINDAAGLFKYNVDSGYLQDAWEITPELTVTAGLRYERYSSNSTPTLNPRFLARYGFSNTSTYDGRDLWLPRVSFKYDVTPDTVVRGGAGLFGGGSPNVWISNSYSNTGIVTGSTTINRPAAGVALTALQAAALNNVTGKVPAAVQASLVAGDGNVNALDPNFKMPSTWKASVGVDHNFDAWIFGDDWTAKADLIYSRVNQAVFWKELRRTRTGTAPDGRPIYSVTVAPPGAPATPTSGNDLLLTNTDQGRGWVASFALDKEWNTDIGDINLELSYTWMDVTEVNPGTSSTAQSNWDNVATYDINNPVESTSNYELKHNFVVATEWSKAFWGDYETSITLFGQARTGRPYSYTFAGNSSPLGDPRQGSRQRQLFYVPKDANDVNLTGGLTWDALNQYIIDNGLDKYRGQIAPRNAFRSPPVATLDMRVTQEIPGLFEDSKGVFSMDIRNLTNLINSSWGRDIQIGFPFVVPVVEATSVAGGKYTYSGPLRTKNRTLTARTSVWQIQFGARYEF